MNNVTLIGRLVADPELKFLPGSGTALTQFTLAVDKGLSKAKKEEFKAEGKQTADFPRIKVWGKQGENAAKYLAKGRLVAVQGKIETGSYDKDDGTKVYTTDVNAFHVEFLEWGDNNGGSSNNQASSEGEADYQEIEDDDVPF